MNIRYNKTGHQPLSKNFLFSNHCYIFRGSKSFEGFRVDKNSGFIISILRKLNLEL